MSKDLTSKEYINWLGEIKERIRSSQQKAALAVNRELLDLYWFLGEALANKATDWGDKFIDNLARDLKVEFPDMKGFSKRNLEYMRRWYDFYASNEKIAQQAVAQLQIDPKFLNTQQAVAQSSESSQQAVDQNIKPLLISVPWGTHIAILTKTKSPEEAFFYLVKTIQNNWSRSSLINQIQSDLYSRQGKALNNFDLTLPDPNADLAKEIIKNPYNFDFLTLHEDAKEKEVERALIQHIKKFMLELGKGFAYVGNQYNLNVDGDDFFLDLLFFNYNLNCFVVFELKVGEFKPEFAGKLNMYVNTVNEQVKLPNHKETIGILLCKTPNETVVKYSLKGIDSPLGVSEYMFKTALPEDLKGDMPSIEQLEEELKEHKNPLEEKREKLLALINKQSSDEITQAVNKGIIEEIIQNVYFRIIKILDGSAQMKEIQELFLSSYNEYFIDNSFAQDMERFNEILEENKVPRSLGFRIYLKGLRKLGEQAFDIRTGFTINFSEFKYAISIEDDFFDTSYKIYGKYFSDAELKEVGSKVVEYTYDEIEKRIPKQT